MLLVARAAHALSLARCDAQLATKPDAEATASCFYDLAKPPRDHAEVARRMREIDRSTRLPWFSFFLAYVAEDEGDPAAAQGLYRSAAARFAASGNVRGELRARTNLIRLLDHQEQRDEKRLEENRAIAIARSARDPLIAVSGQILEANQLFESGRELHRAYVILQHVDRLLDEQPPTPDQHNMWNQCLGSLGNIALELSDFGAAKSYYTRQSELARGDRNASRMAPAQYGIARTAIEPFAEAPREKDRAKPVELTRQALDLALAAPDSRTAAEANLALAGLERGTAPRKHLEACLDETKGNPLFRSFCLNQRARYFAAAGDLGTSEAAAAQAFDLAGDDPWAKARAHGSAMRVAWARGQLAAVIAAGEATLHAIEAIRGDQETSASQAGLFSTWSDDFYWLAGRLMGAEERAPALLARAFDAVERLRARTLLDTLVKAQVEPPSHEDLEARWKALDEALARVRERAGDRTLTAIEREHAREDTDELAREQKQVRGEIARLAHLAKPTRFATLAQIQQHLGPHEALLSFQVAPWTDWTGDFGGGTWLTVMTRGAAPHAYALTAMGRPDLRREVEDFLATLTPEGVTRRLPSRLERKLAADLYAKLLVPALAALPRTVDQLIIVPDDELHRLPFGALQASPEGPPLARRYDLSLAPSATLWLQWRESKKATPPSVLALANPPLPDEATRQRFAESGINLPEEPLPYAEREAAAAVDCVGRGKERTGADVSKPHLLGANLSPYGLLLFATHAWVDERQPDNSGIWLSPGRGPRADGFLRMQDIAALDLNNRAVVLSACSTASGKLLRGEGVLSLARAFFEAKASTVVASLWPQWDDDSAALFERFYLHLAEGKSLAAALAEAQRDRMEAGAPPSAWAGFVVLGDGDRVPLPGGRGWLFLHRRPLALAGAAAAVALALLAGAWTRRSSQSE